MTLPLKSHFRARLVVLFCGLVAAFVGFSLFPRWHQPGTGLFFMPVLVFVGAYIVQLVLGYLVPAQCPNCGADSAVPAGSNLAQYVCKACGTEVNALQSFVAKLEARAAAAPPPPEPAPAQEAQTGSRWVKGLLVIAATCIGIAIWLGDESIRLALGGVSTEARVLSVKVTTDRGGTSNERETRHTALIEYKVGAMPLTLERSWTTKSGTFWTWPNYQSGEQLKVIYLPGTPRRASIDTLAELFLTPIILLLVGLICAGISVLIIRSRRSSEAPDGTLVLDEQTQGGGGPPTKFLKPAIALGVLLAVAGVYYYVAIVQPDLERQKMEAAERAEAARLQSEKAAAARRARELAADIAAAQMAPQPGMSECQALLLRQRNQWVEKQYPYRERFFSLRPPAGAECPDCLAGLGAKLKSWMGFDILVSHSPSGFKPGCVGYRQDIYGSAEGAKCIADFLGSGFNVGQCIADGFPYTITYPVQK